MTGILMTQVSTPIIGQAAWLLGKIMDGIYRVMDLIGIHNLGVCIILLTIVIYTLLMPLTIKQQKFSKMSAAMNPELQKVQQKYKGKNDQASMQKMQEETQLVYEKYGVSPTGGCLSMFIQFPILWAMYYVIRNIPAYVGQVKAVYTPILTSIMAQDGWQKVMEKIGEAKPILMSASKYDYSDKNVLIDVLYKFQTSTWETLGKKLPDLQSTIDSTVDTLKSMNNFLGLNIAETPMNLISNGVKAGAWGIVIMAVLIPVLSGLSQYLSVKLSQQTTAVTNNPQADQMASTMKTMNVTLPLVSVFMCFTLPTGLGIYWVASAVVRMVQQFFINKHLNKIPMDELIKENMEKAAEKRKNKNEVDASNVNKMAHKNVKNIHEPVRTAAQTKELEEKLEEAKKKKEKEEQRKKEEEKKRKEEAEKERIRKEEAEKKAAAPAEESTVDFTHEEEIDFDTFCKVELRVAEVRACENLKESKKLLHLTVFDGERERCILSGIAKWFKPEDLIGKKLGIVCNLAPRPMLKGKYVSEGMIFAADTADGGCSIAFYGDDTPVGSRIH